MMKIDGNEIARKIRSEISKEVSELSDPPVLGVILATSNPGSEIYVDRKMKACKETGIQSILVKTSSVDEIKKTIDTWNQRKEVNGILLQLPVDGLDDPSELFSLIDPLKDVDVFHPVNTGLLCQGRPRYKPCTPHGIIKMLEHIKVPILGKKVTVINSSNVVGKPLSNLLIQEGGTVTVCHDRTPPHILYAACQNSDIIVVAVGIPEFLKVEMVRPGTVVIDVGITRVGKRVVGDVHKDVSQVAGAISGVPGGVGPCTVAMLLHNTLQAYNLQNSESVLH
jgi:methylenetetrahydrofolate dehydrogenase (NADP+)/methenyltetrahydrofolate cyclohydrolase